MKKKLLCAVLIGCCVLGLSACGKSEAEQAADYYENELGMDKDDAEELANAFYGEEESKDATEVADDATGEIVVSDEILAADRFSNKIQIGNTVYEFPLTVEKFLESGEFTIEGWKEEPDVNVNSLVPVGEWKTFTLKGNGVNLLLSAENDSTSMTELKNCIVSGGFWTGATRYNIATNIIWAGGLRIGMPYSEFQELFGEPDYIDSNIYYYYENMYYHRDDRKYASANGYGYSIEIDMDNACVSEISYSMGERRGTEYKECVLTCNDCSVQYYMPDDFLYEGYRNCGYRELNGEKYVIERGDITFGERPYYDGTAESLCITARHMIESTVNDDGSVFVIECWEEPYRDEWCQYDCHYYMNGYCLNVQLKMYPATKDVSVTEAAKQEMLNLIKEIFSKGVTIK